MASPHADPSLQALAEAAAAIGVALRREQLDALARYRDELLRWNRRVNLTSVTDPAGVATRHFLDSLTVLAALPSGHPPPSRVADVGSGAGFPGLPLLLARPGPALTLIESTQKKAAFLQHVIRVLKLPGVTVLARRAEDAGRDPNHRERYDLVLARAVAPLSTLAELTLPLCALGGLVALHKSGDVAPELDAAQKALATLGGAAPDVRPIRAPGLPPDRLLLLIRKVAPTPERYPRRPGIPARRPIA